MVNVGKCLSSRFASRLCFIRGFSVDDVGWGGRGREKERDERGEDDDDDFLD